ncbi:hypothetical protein AAGW05_00965 [Arthrobacter sp. LAPM80]|uniref:hypothetical protein n=1 Tax=Arthrobacter sp. LAPM80 TaxID=3141788 RepID=UPI00398B0D28
MVKGLVNSLVVSAIIAIGTAYVLARFTFMGPLTMLRGLLGLQSIPSNLMLLPVCVLFASIGSWVGITIIGTLWVVHLADAFCPAFLHLGHGHLLADTAA